MSARLNSASVLPPIPWWASPNSTTSLVKTKINTNQLIHPPPPVLPAPAPPSLLSAKSSLRASPSVHSSRGTSAAHARESARDHRRSVAGRGKASSSDGRIRRGIVVSNDADVSRMNRIQVVLVKCQPNRAASQEKESQQDVRSVGARE